MHGQKNIKSPYAGCLNLLEPSGSVMGLSMDYFPFTFVWNKITVKERTGKCPEIYSNNSDRVRMYRPHSK